LFKSELLLSIGAEGGSIAVYGTLPIAAMGAFKVGIVDHTPTFLDESEGGRVIRRDSGWLSTWRDALQALDRYPWRNLHPLYVHPRCKAAVWEAVERGTPTAVSGFAASALERWREHCCSVGQRESLG
jgi:hypothetical protein